MMGRKSTSVSKTGDLVGKVVMAVKEIVERKKVSQKNKKGSMVAHHLSQLSPLLAENKGLIANGNNNRNIMATMKDILVQVQQSSCVVSDGAPNEVEGITPALLKAAVKRAVMRGFLNETGKYYSIDNSKEFNIKGRKRRYAYDILVPTDMSNVLIEDDGSSDGSLSDSSSFLSNSLSALTSPPVNMPNVSPIQSTPSKCHTRLNYMDEAIVSPKSAKKTNISANLPNCPLDKSILPEVIIMLKFRVSIFNIYSCYLYNMPIFVEKILV